jgi:hypothetical protein
MNEPAPAPTPPCMRVRTRRFRSDDQDSVPIARCDRTATSLKSHASHRILQAIRSPIRGHHGNLRTGGRTSAHRFSPSPTSSLPVSSFTRAFRPPARRAGIMASAAACCPSGCASPRSVTFPQLPSSSICPTVHPGKEVHIQGTLTPLARAHAGRTQFAPPYSSNRARFEETVSATLGTEII